MSNIILTEEQKKIVEHFGSPLRVLAGPGTGKTFCIIEKIKYLLINKNIPYADISTITFTNAAATELRQRLHKSGIKADQFPYANTLHGLAMSVLKKNISKIGLDSCFKPLDNFTKRILIKDTEQDLRNKKIFIQRSEKYFYIKAYEQEKHRSQVPDVITTDKNKKKIYEEFKVSFQSNLSFYNLLCWEDVLLKTIDLLDRFKEIKDEVHLRTKYLLVDEFQDLSPLEQNFIEKICANKDGLCIVGDDDQ
ncbi:MAG: UvrD-helicase domain-containing protein, partial [Elusimicrobiota bacterium]